MREYKGGDLVSGINKLGVELHIPGYQYCGPGTKVLKRIARGDQGINKLDKACKQHDLKYLTYSDLQNRHIADKQLAEEAWNIVKSKDASYSEKAAAYAVTNIMKLKRKFGMGINKSVINKKMSYIQYGVTLSEKQQKKIIKGETVRIKHVNLTGNVKLPLTKTQIDKIQKCKIENKGIDIKLSKAQIKDIDTTKTGGFLPALIPLIAPLIAKGLITGTAAAVAGHAYRKATGKGMYIGTEEWNKPTGGKIKNKKKYQ